ncbi:hypothetical protein RCL1_008235 [Eukaryota sp. TZLM3-RCL]
MSLLADLLGVETLIKAKTWCDSGSVCLCKVATFDHVICCRCVTSLKNLLADSSGWKSKSSGDIHIVWIGRFNQLRTEFLAHLLNFDSKFLREDIFAPPILEVLALQNQKSFQKLLIGSGKTFVFEFSSRFSPDLALLSSNCSPFLLALEHEINTLPLDVWMKCFPIEVQEIPVKNLSNLKYAKKKLQHFLVKELESLDYTNRLCLAKMNNPAFYQFHLDNTDSSASSFFSQIPQIYGLLLNNEEWETFIRLRCYLWPQQLVNGLKCKNEPSCFSYSPLQLPTSGHL